MMMRDIHLNRIVTFKQLGRYGLLGNQMFQIAATIGYAKKHNISYKLPRWLSSDGTDLSLIFKGPFEYSDISSLTTKDFSHLEMWYKDIPYCDQNLNLHGYFQNEKYFENIKTEIREIFSALIPTESLSGICSIHVRRGDYLKYPSIHTNIGMAYYKKAVDMMKEYGYSKFLIFSDDISWCKENFIGEEYLFSERRKNYDDLIMMSTCDSHIIANSSFSWWGAWLGKNNKYVIEFLPINN